MTDREVIARRTGSARPMYLLSAILGVAILIVSVLFMGQADGETGQSVTWGMLIVVGVLVAVLGLWYFVKTMKTPDVICEREGDHILFLGKNIPLKDILNVRCRRAHSRYGDYGWGKLTVDYAGGSIESDFVADVEAVHDRLITLMREYAAEGKGE